METNSGPATGKSCRKYDIITTQKVKLKHIYGQEIIK